jgi:hypothetical protein
MEDLVVVVIVVLIVAIVMVVVVVIYIPPLPIQIHMVLLLMAVIHCRPLTKVVVVEVILWIIMIDPWYHRPFHIHENTWGCKHHEWHMNTIEPIAKAHEVVVVVVDIMDRHMALMVDGDVVIRV